MYILFGCNPAQTWFCASIQSTDKVTGHKTVPRSNDWLRRLTVYWSACVYLNFSELCTQHILCACLAWFRGGARPKPHSRSTVVWTWWKWAPSALPSGCGTFQLSLLSVKSLVLWLSFCSTETASRSWGEFLSGSRGGQLKDKALLQESLRGEERGTRKLF